ncbi:MAG: hypothetical protein IPN18_04895 [Ignavibacteriales bacterium]|nr:hypothetical protein [Ignavibacteriales bacterium]
MIDQISAVSAGGGVIVFMPLHSFSKQLKLWYRKPHIPIAFCGVGMFRYMYVVYQHHRGENTIDILL